MIIYNTITQPSDPSSQCLQRNQGGVDYEDEVSNSDRKMNLSLNHNLSIGALPSLTQTKRKLKFLFP